jgi:3-phenylpropionate/trans-cinnamate dioxygenase ferredoxin reductase subunit
VHAARRLLAEAGVVPVVPYRPVPWFWSDQYDRKLQLAGSTTGAQEVRVVAGSLSGPRFVALYRRGERLVAAFAAGAARAMVRYRRLLEDDPSWEQGLAASEHLAPAA